MRLGWIFKGLFLLALSAVVFGSAAWFGYQLILKPRQVPPEALVNGKLAPPVDPSLSDFDKTMQIVDSRADLVKSRAALEKFMTDFPFSTKLADARKALGKVNSDIFFSTINSPDKVHYEIRSGDALAKIERKLKTTGEIIMRCNNLDDPRRLRIGQTLLISPAEFTVVIDRKTHIVTLFNQGKFFREYAAASWTAPEPKRGKEKVVIDAKVSKKLAFKDGNPVNFPSKDYMGSERWVETTAKGFTLYTEGAQQKPTGGIGIAPEEMEEISTLVAKGAVVTIR
jgi:hypothetical protein